MNERSGINDRHWISTEKPEKLGSEVVYNHNSGNISIEIKNATPLIRYQYEVFIGTKSVPERSGTIFADRSQTARVDLVLLRDLNPNSISVKIVAPTKSLLRS